MRTALGLALVLGLSQAACAAEEKRPLTAAEYSANAKKAYDEAMEAFHAEDWVSVPLLMEEVKREYASSRYARLAQLRIADAHFHQESYPEAITAYREFVRDYPNDSEVPYARYRVVLCQFRSSGDSAILPPLEERDLSSVRDANESIDAFLRDYPNHPKLEELHYMQSWVRGMLARHELYVARFYLSRDNFDAAVARSEFALNNYYDTGLEPEALVLMGETYMKMGELEKARGAFNIVVRDYPSSPFTVPAKNFLAKMGEPIRKVRLGAEDTAPSHTEADKSGPATNGVETNGTEQTEP